MIVDVFKPFEREENPFIKSLCDTECYVKIASIASGQFQSELPIFKMNGNANRNLKGVKNYAKER